MNTTENPSFSAALLSISGVFLLISYALVQKNSFHGIMGLAIGWVVLVSLFQSKNLSYLVQQLISSIKLCSSAITIFVLISFTIAMFIMSGAIPTVIYYGMGIINPNYFLPIGFTLCSITSLIIGSCWGTIGTIGVILIGLSKIMGIPLPITAGMIVSGAYFGDKISPTSDTTVLSAFSTETNLYHHIKGMTYTLIPLFIVVSFIFYLIGLIQCTKLPSTNVEIYPIQTILTQSFHIHYLALAPIFVLLILNLCKIRPTISMTFAIISAFFIGLFIQNFSAILLLQSLIFGPQGFNSDNLILNSVLNHGGLVSIKNSLSLSILILMLGGMIQGYGYINTLVRPFLKYINTPTLLITSTLILCIFTNMLLGEAYLTIVLISKIFHDKYTTLNLDSSALSKAIEQGAIFTTPLIPWSTSGIFIYCTLGVSVMDYLPWAILNWLSPIIYIVFTTINFMGVKHFKSQKMKLEIN